MGGVTGVSTMADLERSGDATVSTRDLPRPTLVVGLGILYLMVLLYQNLYVYILDEYMYYDLEHWWSLASPWSDGARKGLNQPGLF